MVIQSFLPVLGGAQRQVDLLGPLLQRRGVELTVITRRPPGTPRREIRPGLEVKRMAGPDKGALGSIAYTLEGALSISRLRPHVVHVHDLLSPATIALLSHPIVRAPVIAKVLSTGPGGDLDRLLTKPFGRKRLSEMAKQFSAFLCLSDDVAEELADYGVDRQRLRHIPNGVDTERFRPASDTEREVARSQSGLSGEGTLALYTGRFEPVKRLDRLIQALAQTNGIRIVMVGEGSEEGRLRRFASDLGLTSRVAVLSRVDDPTSLYRAADLYVSASSTEGMSNSVLEAMASGLPIVAARASGMAELVTGKTGVLVDDATDSMKFGSALESISSNPSLRRRLGAEARALVVDRYSLESVADQLRDLYDRVLLTR